MHDAANGIRTTPAAAPVAKIGSPTGPCSCSVSVPDAGPKWRLRGLFAVGQARFGRLEPVRHAPAAPVLAGAARWTP